MEVDYANYRREGEVTKVRLTRLMSCRSMPYYHAERTRRLLPVVLSLLADRN